MNKINALSFWTPIVPQINTKSTAIESMRCQADHLLSYGHHIYRLGPNNTLKLENRPHRSNWEIAKQITLLATLILPLAAAIIKVIDRCWHKYTLIAPATKPASRAPQSNSSKNENIAGSTAITKADSATESAHMKGMKTLASTPDRVEEQPFQPLKSASSAEVMAPSNSTTISTAPEMLDKQIIQNPPVDWRSDYQRQTEQVRKAKEAAEAERVVQERISNVKCHAIAKLFFSAMTELFYHKDGRLNNRLRNEHFWSARNEYNPESLRERAKEIENDDPQEAAGYLKEADEIELEHPIDDLQKTFFPVMLADKSVCTFEDLTKECQQDFSNQELFHGTSKEQATGILKEGFDPAWMGGANVKLDTGFGAYLAIKQSDAVHYAKKNKNGEILQATVRPNGKIAEYNRKMYFIVEDHFARMADFFVEKKSTVIRKLMKEEGVPEWELIGVKRSLLNQFTQDFYVRNGFRGVYATGSLRGTCDYLNLFYPKEDIVQIETVQLPQEEVAVSNSSQK